MTVVEIKNTCSFWGKCEKPEHNSGENVIFALTNSGEKSIRT